MPEKKPWEIAAENISASQGLKPWEIAAQKKSQDDTSTVSTQPVSQPTTPSSGSGTVNLPPITLGEETLRAGQATGDVIQQPLRDEASYQKGRVESMEASRREEGATLDRKISEQLKAKTEKEKQLSTKEKIYNYLKGFMGQQPQAEGEPTITEEPYDPTPIDVFKPIDLEIEQLNPQYVREEGVDEGLRKNVVMKNLQLQSAIKKDKEQMLPELQKIKTVGDLKKLYGQTAGEVVALSDELKKDNEQLKADYDRARKVNEGRLQELGFTESFGEGIKQTQEANAVANALYSDNMEGFGELLEKNYTQNYIYGDREVNSLGQLLGGQALPIGVTFTAAVLSGGNPAVAGLAGTGYYARLGAGSEAIQVYNEARSQGRTHAQAVAMAAEASKAGFVAGGVEGALGSTFGVGELAKGAMKLTQPTVKAILATAADLGVDAGAAVGAQYYKNMNAIKQGIERDELEGLAEEGMVEALFGLGSKGGIYVGTLGFQMLAKQANKIKANSPKAYNQLIAQYGKASPAVVLPTIEQGVKNGDISPADAERLTTDLTKSYAAQQKLEGVDIPADKEAEVVQLQTKIDDLEAQKKTASPAVLPAIEKQIADASGELQIAAAIGLTSEEKMELNKLQTAKVENKAYDKDRLKVLEKRQEAFEQRGKDDANAKAKELGYNSATHLLNKIKKEGLGEFENVQDVPQETLEKLAANKKFSELMPNVGGEEEVANELLKKQPQETLEQPKVSVTEEVTPTEEVTTVKETAMPEAEKEGEVKTDEDAIQEQTTDEGVLRQERPEVELQAVGERNAQPESVTQETEKPTEEGSVTTEKKTAATETGTKVVGEEIVEAEPSKVSEPTTKTEQGNFTTTTEPATMPDGEDGVKVTLQKPDGEKVDLGVMYPEDVETEVAKKIRGYKLQQAKPEATTQPQAEQPATDLTGKNVTFEHAGSETTGVVQGVDEKGNLKVKDSRGINYTVKPDKATEVSEITAAKNDLFEAWNELKNLTDPNKLGIKGTDPQAQAEAVYKIHQALVRMAKAYIAKGINDVKKFASAVGITAKQAQQAWGEATGAAKYAAEDLAYDVAELTKTAIKRGVNVRKKFAEYKQAQKDIKKSISDFINDAEIKKAISPVQVRALVSRAAKVTTEAQLDKFIDYAQKVIDNADYSVEMDEVRDMQQKARKRNHVSFNNIVREFTSITPESIPDNLLVAYKTALDGLMARVPSYKAMEEIFYEIATANIKPDKFSNIQTFNQAQELYNSIALNKVQSIEDYRSLFKDINGFKRRVEQLFENGDITEDERDDLINQVGKDQAEVESKYASEIASLKTDLINEIHAKQKSTGISQLSTEEKKLLERFYKLNNDDLRSLSPEELYNLSSILDNVMEEGRVDVLRLSPLVDRAEATAEANSIAQQVKKAKPFEKLGKSIEEQVSKLGLTYSSFWEAALGLGAAKYGAFQKYYVAPIERAIAEYRRDVQDGYKFFNDLKKKYGVDNEEQMNRIGMIATYLREYGMSNDPKYKGKADAQGKEFGTRDWFEFVLTDPKERAKMTPSELKDLQKLYDSLPKTNGAVSPEDVYNSFIANDGKYLNQKEMTFLKEVMDWRDKNMTGKQKYANELRGKLFEQVLFHLKRIRKWQTGAQAAAPVEVNAKTGNVRISAGSGKEVTTNEMGLVETNFEKIFSETLEENARDYHLTPTLQKLNEVLRKTNEALGEDKQPYVTVMKNNLAEAINQEFSTEQANKLAKNLLKARAAQVLIAPARTVVEAVAALASYPLRAGVPSAYVELFRKRDAVSKLLKQTNSPYQNRVDLSRQFEVQKGSIEGESTIQKASELFAALPERIGLEPVWMAVFNNAFKEETGVSFDRNKYNSDPSYAAKYDKAIKAAGAVADATYGQIAGSTTRAGSRREIKILPEKIAKSFGLKEGINANRTSGVLAAFMTGYPYREVEQVFKSVQGLTEALKGAEYSKGDVAKQIAAPMGIAISALAYNYGQALNYQMQRLLLGDEEEKKKAKEDIDNLFTSKTFALEALSTMLATLGTRYSGFSRTAMTWLGSAYYNLAETKEEKQAAKDFIRNLTFQEPIEIKKKKSGEINTFGLEGQIALSAVNALPSLGVAVDNAFKAAQSVGGLQYLYKKVEKGEALTNPEKEALIGVYVAVNMGNAVSQLFGYAIPNTTLNKLAKQAIKEGNKPQPQKQETTTTTTDFIIPETNNADIILGQ